MNLYLLSQSSETGYDTYDSCVVAAMTSRQAKTFHPGGYLTKEMSSNSGTWPSDVKKITAEKIGVADPSLKPGVIIASFNAG